MAAKEVKFSTEFAPHGFHSPFYLARGWKPFDGEILCEQPQGGVKARVRFEAIAPYVHDIGRAPRRGGGRHPAGAVQE